jgi:glucose/arabinose dehydrogenase
MMLGRNAAALWILLCIGLAAVGCRQPGTQEVGEATLALAQGFTGQVVLNNFNFPTSVRFAPDGTIFVSEKGGLIKAFDSDTDITPTVVVDLASEVYSLSDRGLLDIELDPGYPARPYLYALYTFDGLAGDTTPRYNDQCNDANSSCPCLSRLVRFTLSLSTKVATARVTLVENWGGQFTAHSIGSIRFGRDGMLYVSSGEGSNFNAVDYGNFGNPLGDPPNATGSLTPPNAMGGALRAQIINPPAATPAYPKWFSGKVVRIDPDGAPLLDPRAITTSPVVASGLRNPFRMTFRPGTNELWVADVGWNAYEEIDRIDDATANALPNFGWPCYEGPNPQPGFQAIGLDVCTSLYNAGNMSPPVFHYNHVNRVVPGDASEPTGSSAVTAVAFYAGTIYPSVYRGALFFGDYARQKIWYAPAGSNGQPDFTQIAVFAHGTAVVQLVNGPDGSLWWVDIVAGTLMRAKYVSGNSTPLANITVDRSAGPLPLTVHFDASMSSDADPGDILTYAWDLDNDGQFNDGSGVTAVWTYMTSGATNARLRVTDQNGAAGEKTLPIFPGANPPVPAITYNGPTTWKAGDVLSFVGSATDVEDGSIPGSSLSWSAILYHCPISGCHQHFLRSQAGTASFGFTAPAHEYPAHLELRLTAVDSAGMSATVSISLEPTTSTVTLSSSPPGLQLVISGEQSPAPVALDFIVGSPASVAAPAQVFQGTLYEFVSWSDGLASAHDFVVGATNVSLLATYRPAAGPNLPPSADAGAQQTVTPGALVTLDASGSSDPEGNFLTYAWTQVSGTLATLSGANTSKPTFTAPVSAANSQLVFSVAVSDNANPPVSANVTITVGPASLGLVGQPIALIMQPTGGGSRNLETIRDGVKPPPGSGESAQQYDTYTGGGARAFDWVGYTFASSYSFTKLVFEEGNQYANGGWLTNLTVQVLQNGAWNNVSGLVSTPLYAGANGVNYDTYVLTFSAIIGTGIRVYGAPGGSAAFFSVGELEVYGTATGGGTNLRPIADAGPDTTLVANSAVTLNGTGSSDPNGDSLAYAWTQTAGTSVALSGANTASATFRAPSAAATLTFSLTVSDGVLTSTDAVVITVQAAGSALNLASSGTPVALVTAPTGGGNHNIEIIRDGVVPALGSAVNAQQYDTYAGGGARAFDWIGYTFPSSYSFTKLVFEEGMQFPDGGWLTNLTVQVLQNGSWNAVSGLVSTPTYAGANGVNYDSYVLTFNAITGTGIRIYGAPGGGAAFISVGELEAYGTAVTGGGNLAPIANAGPDATLAASTTVTLNGTGSSDPNGDSLAYAWTQTAGTAVMLSGANTASPTFLAPATVATLTFSLTVSDGSLTSTDTVVITVQAAGGAPNLAPAGTPVALVTAPTGGGNHNIEIIRDGVKPVRGSAVNAQQYDTYAGGGARAFDWIGYTFPSLYSFTKLVFEEGMQFPDGGWLTNPTVQVLQNGTWNAVSGLVSTPTYAGANGTSYDTYALTFDPTTGTGIRIYGAPGGSAAFISVGELEVYGTAVTGGAVNLASSGTPVALVTAPTGGGNHNIEIIRDGLRPAAGSAVNAQQYDTYSGGAARVFDWIGYTFPVSYSFTKLVFQEGMQFADGGWLTNLTVQVLQNGTWNPVSGLVSTPAYAGANGVSYDTYALTFSASMGTGIRIYGAPGGSAAFISVGELEVYGTAVTGGAVNLASSGTPVALVTAPTGGGNHNIEIIRDGEKPAVGSASSAQQYDTYSGGAPRAFDWIGYTFPSSQAFTKLVFQEGKQFADGGWLTNLTVQVLQNGTWNTVSGLVSTPAYAGANGVNYDTYVLTFSASTGTGIRIYGAPGGGAAFISVAELEVY